MTAPARSIPCPNCGHRLRRKPWQPGADVIRAHAPHCNPEAWCGCGTASLAAKRLGVRSIAIEAEERWCEVAARRLAQDALDFEAS